MKQISEKLNGAQRILIFPHINPDWDTVGSAFAMQEYLKSLGKEAIVLFENQPSASLLFLGGEYAVFGDALPKGEYISLAIDCGAESMLGDRLSLFKEGALTLSVDHHGTNTHFAEVNFVDTNASATGEIVASFLSEEGVITPSIASFLYAAILTDTGSFRFSNTTPSTMRIAALLMEKGAQSAEISTQIYENQTLTSYRVTARAIHNLKLFHQARTAMIVFSPQDMEELSCSPDDTDNLSGIGRSIEGVEVSISAKPQRDGYKVSMRSKHFVDVSQICKGFGGGGHPRAAGFFVEGEFPAIETILLNAVETQYRRGAK